MVQNISHITLCNFIAQFSQHGILQKSGINITSAICFVCLHQHLGHPTTLSNVLEKLEGKNKTNNSNNCKQIIFTHKLKEISLFTTAKSFPYQSEKWRHERL